MTNKTQLILFTGTDCHLCDLAKNLLMGVDKNVDIEEINVKEQREYFHEFGARIPVLKNKLSGAELPWPFDPDQLSLFLQGRL